MADEMDTVSRNHDEPVVPSPSLVGVPGGLPPVNDSGTIGGRANRVTTPAVPKRDLSWTPKVDTARLAAVRALVDAEYQRQATSALALGIVIDRVELPVEAIYAALGAEVPKTPLVPDAPNSAVSTLDAITKAKKRYEEASPVHGRDDLDGSESE